MQEPIQETIVHVLEAEKKASEIIANEEKEFSIVISNANAKLLEELNNFRATEQKRFNREINKVEAENKARINNSINTLVDKDIDLNIVSEKIVMRVLRTVFD